MLFEINATQPTILYVEDDSNDILLLQHAFQRISSGCNLVVFSEGEEAMAYLKGTDQFADRERFPFPHLGLIDLKMPKVNGFELLAWIRSEPGLCRLPVVVLSSSNHAMDVRRAYDSGANSYLVKPIDFSALIELARSIQHYWLALNYAARGVHDQTAASFRPGIPSL